GGHLRERRARLVEAVDDQERDRDQEVQEEHAQVEREDVIRTSATGLAEGACQVLRGDRRALLSERAHTYSSIVRDPRNFAYAAIPTSISTSSTIDSAEAAG